MVSKTAAKSAAADPLETYRAKRDFGKTREPSGGTGSVKGNVFIVQKHDATRLHYDFRLELDGVLLSWAVTRGPSANPDDKRLAVRTEDHPLDYATFEGTIPKGEYGGGTVMLWDSGTWDTVQGKDPRKTIPEGHLHFVLHGSRMKGEWIMIRLKPRGKEKHESWLLRKVADEYAGGSDDLIATHLTGVSSGLTMAQIAEGKTAEKKAARKKPGKATKGKSALPPFQPVQLATLVDHVPAGNAWLHEMKYDGYRTLIATGGGQGRAYTRSGLDWTEKFAGIVDAATGLDASAMLLDGEAVVLDTEGRTSFHALQGALKDDRAQILYYAFDLLSLDGQDLTALPLTERKAKLAALIGDGSPKIRYSGHIVGRGEELFETFCKAGLEGVVSKRADAPYSGSRSGAWVKTKCIQRQEFVIVGWTPSDKQRGFRALLLGVNDDGKLRYAGKVGTGFDTAEIDKLIDLMMPLATDTPTVEAPRTAVRGAHWIRPQLVAEVAFMEVTADGVLRHSSYIGLREDKHAEAVVLEKQAPVAVVEAPASPVKITNRDRVIFPEGKITKGALADYYQQVAQVMLPWAGSRPISLVRCPQGRGKACFFQKHDAGSFGDHVHHVSIAEKDGHEDPYLFVDDADGLVTCVQMGTIEFHGWGARIENVETADRLVFDLDPDEGLSFKEVIAAAVHVQDLLGEIGLVTFPMVTGGKGVHVIAPLTPQAEWPAVKDFAHRFATVLAQSEPDRFTAALAKAKRKGRIFVDYLRNQRGATAVMPYSVRARENAPVAVPVTWEELRTMDAASHWHLSDATELIRRAGSKDLAGWGRADQVLPDL
ncbi:DNA ligase D [Novosphingobium sp.]|uniref:DNA ligase D n=1 Tax=Novosphingobium sp. TaxID=1874826 RepID=UPI003B517887